MFEKTKKYLGLAVIANSMLANADVFEELEDKGNAFNDGMIGVFAVFFLGSLIVWGIKSKIAGRPDWQWLIMTLIVAVIVFSAGSLVAFIRG